MLKRVISQEALLINSVDKIKRILNENMDYGRDYSDEELLEQIEEEVFTLGNKEKLSLSEKTLLIKMVFNAIRQLDLLQPLIDNDLYIEIMVNGLNPIQVETRYGELIDLDYGFQKLSQLEDIIQKIVGKMNRVVNEASPIVDVRTKEGFRVNIVLPPIAIDGPVITIRKFPRGEFRYSLEDFGLTDVVLKEFISKLVQYRYNIFISGGTSSGKTTLLNVLTSYCSERERIITIEDSAELNLHKSGNIVRLETRNANSQGVGELRMGELIKSALRMRPDRIIVGEVRGSEVYNMLEAMNTGHDGSLSTGHANSARDMLVRLEGMAMIGTNIPKQSIQGQMTSALEILIHVTKSTNGKRQIVTVSEVQGMKNGEFIIHDLMKVENGCLIKTEEGLINCDKWVKGEKGEIQDCSHQVFT